MVALQFPIIKIAWILNYPKPVDELTGVAAKSGIFSRSLQN